MKTNWLVIVFLLTGCIDEFPLDGDIPPPEPVIEGLVSDMRGVSFVRISSSLSILGIRDGTIAAFGSDALVDVVDDQGVVTSFCEKSPGLYRPDEGSFVGEVGKQYRLTVTTADGNSYHSDWELMHPGVAVDSIFTLFRQTVLPNTEQISGSHDFYATVSDQSGNEVQFRIETLGIAQVGAFLDPPPPGCNTPCAEICFSYRNPVNRQQVIGTTGNVAEGKLTLQVATEPYDYHSYYFFRVITHSLSPSGYQFWSSIADQQQIEGSIFDPQLNEIAGTNMTSVESSEPIIGYFGASATSADSILFNRSESANFQTPIPTARRCVDVWKGATLEVPIQFK